LVGCMVHEVVWRLMVFAADGGEGTPGDKLASGVSEAGWACSGLEGVWLIDLLGSVGLEVDM